MRPHKRTECACERHREIERERERQIRKKNLNANSAVTIDAENTTTTCEEDAAYAVHREHTHRKERAHVRADAMAFSVFIHTAGEEDAENREPTRMAIQPNRDMRE